ncbi:MAG: hypothetical protein MUO72_10990 [Bacteroidales bacterium]|nr:hypothetical protein [Bacteroidales bacterium]
MRTKTYFIGFMAMFLIVFFCYSCLQKVKESQDVAKIENTLKSVSLIYDSIGVNPSEMLSSFERINKAIDSIGYPDAGYKLWLVQSDSTKDFRFMLEGHWPNQAIYDTIHKNKLYKDTFNEEMKFWRGAKSVSYNRFILVK